MTDSVLCCNDKFPPEFTELYEKYGVVTPKEGKLYTFRKIIKTLKLYPLLRPDFDDYKFILEVYEYAFHFIKMNILVNVMSISELISWMYEKIEDSNDN